MSLPLKILIGMIAGVMIGTFLGPHSPFLPRHDLAVSDLSQLSTQLLEPEQPGPWTLPSAPGRLKIVGKEQRGGTNYLRANLQLDATLRERLPESLRAAASVELLVAEDSVVASERISRFGEGLLDLIRPLGVLFLRLIQMVVVPLVFTSLTVGVANLGDSRSLGRLGVRTLGLFVVTTGLAVVIGLSSATLIRPGAYVSPAGRDNLQAQFGDQLESANTSAAELSFVDQLVHIVPNNPFKAFADGDMLAIVFFATIFGVALTLMDRERALPVVALLDRIQDAMVVVIQMVMRLAPLGVAAMVADVVGRSGWSVLVALAAYAGTVVLGLFIHVSCVYFPAIRLIAGLSVGRFLRAMRPAQLLAFSTSSSSATLPVTMESLEKRLGVSNLVTSFVVPLGATANMDGTALYQAVATVFIAQAFGVDLTISDQAIVVVTATLASIGAAGVPGAGLVTLALVLQQLNLPAAGIALVLGVDRILDMFRTAVNVTGDAAVATIVARLEGESLIPPTPKPTVEPLELDPEATPHAVVED